MDDKRKRSNYRDSRSINSEDNVITIQMETVR